MINLPDIEYRNRKKKEILENNREIQHTVIGKSILSKDIDCFKIGEGKINVLAVGAHHSLEYISSLALYNFLDFLSENFTRPRTYKGISLDFLLKFASFHIIPTLNPDGVQLHLHGVEKSPLSARQIRLNGGEDFSEWQSNARGVDLNHNYDYDFAEYKKIESLNNISQGKTRFSGEYPESEPETRSLANFVRILNPDVALSFHTQGREIFSAPKTDRVERISRALSALTGYKPSLCQGFAAYGGFCDYTGYVLGIPSFTVELGEGKNPLPLTMLDSITETVKTVLTAIPALL